MKTLDQKKIYPFLNSELNQVRLKLKLFTLAWSPEKPRFHFVSLLKFMIAVNRNKFFFGKQGKEQNNKGS